MTNAKKLYRSHRDKVIGGVAGGLADYFEIDVVIVRLLFVLLVLAGGGGVIGYIILWIVVPMEPFYTPYTEAKPGPQPGPQPGPGNDPKTEPGTEQPSGAPESEAPKDASEPYNSRKNNTSIVAGIILIVLGMVFLANHLLPWFRLYNFWPALLIIGGIFIIEPNLLNSKK